MVLITVHIPEGLLERINKLIREGIYPNRSEFIRQAIIALLMEHGVLRPRKRRGKRES